MNRLLQIGVCVAAAVWLCSCDDAEERRAKYAKKRSAPQSQRTDVTPPPATEKSQHQADNKPVMMEYKGEEIEKLTAVPGKKLLLVFYADWCPQCAAYRTSLEEYALNNKETVLIYTINADQYKKLAQEYKVDAVPKTVLYVEGMRLRDMVGKVSAQTLDRLVKETLAVDKKHES